MRSYGYNVKECGTGNWAASQRVNQRRYRKKIISFKNIKEKMIMLRWVIALLVIALLAAILGFGGVAGAAAGIAKIVFVIFLALAVLSFIFGRTRGI